MLAASCDSTIEDCSMSGIPQAYPQVNRSNVYWMGSVALMNAWLPILYYILSSDYSNNYEETEEDEDDFPIWWDLTARINYSLNSNSISEQQQQQHPRRHSKRRRSPKIRESEPLEWQNRRRRGGFDNSAWFKVSIMHAVFWGTSFLLFVFTLFKTKAFDTVYRFYIEHLLSNFNFVVYIYSLVLLSIDAARIGDV